MSPAKICPHTNPHPDLDVMLVTDTGAVSLADAFVQCRICRQDYFIELIDIKGAASAYRIAALAPDAAASTLKSLTRGSCDINRANAELVHVHQVARPLPGILIRDESDSAQTLWRYVADTKQVKLPTDHWRNLPCDGQIIAALEV
ncbi:MAG: hypothetical protein ACFHXK_01015 [bacterium]